jgi:hypothetical protein
MLRHAHFYTKGGLLPFTARMTNGNYAQELPSHHLKSSVNGGVKSCHWGGAKVGHLVPRLGA